MTGKEFYNRLGRNGADVVRMLLDAFGRTNAQYCVIGGLAVNAYAEPVVSMDLDVVVEEAKIDAVCEALENEFKSERFEHSVNLTHPKSDVRVQIQTDPRYQAFLEHGKQGNVLGYDMRVASVEDVLQGKLWAYLNRTRRASKRQKDLADIFRLVENAPALRKRIPEELRRMMDA